MLKPVDAIGLSPLISEIKTFTLKASQTWKMYSERALEDDIHSNMLFCWLASLGYRMIRLPILILLDHWVDMWF